MLALNDVMNSEQNIPKIVTISIPLNVTGASTATSCVKKDNNHKLLINNDFKILQNIVVKTITQDGAVCIQNVNQVNKPEIIEKIPKIAEQDSTEAGTSNSPPKNKIYLKPIARSKKSENSPKSTTNQTFRCIKCTEQFSTILEYRKHMLNHRNSKKYQCSKCSASYNNERNMEIHMAMHADGKPTCPLCQLTFHRLASLKSHLMLHQVEEIFTCEECKSEYDDEENLLKHYETHVMEKFNENKPIECPYCKVVYEDTNQLKEHISFHMILKKMMLKSRGPKKKPSQQVKNKKLGSHACDKCNKRFMKACLLERHIRTHTGEKPFVCTICNTAFTQKGTLQIHLNKHTGLKPFECTLCPAKFNQKGNLRVHVEKTHTADEKNEKIYKCTSCTCIFKTVASLNGHVTKLHTKLSNENDSVQMVMKKLKELQQQINQTSNNSKEKRPEGDSLMQVMRKLKELQNKQTNNEKKSQLNNENDLGVTYVRLAEPNQMQNGIVRRYLAKRVIVDGVRWYCCNYCPKQFKKPSDLMRHLRIHTREKPFECEECGQSFTLKSTLKVHMNTHKEKQVIKCLKCDKIFKSNLLLHYHMLRKHERKYSPTYECVKCKKLCKTTKAANQHLDEKHPHANFEDCMKFVLKQPIFRTAYGNLVIRRKQDNVNEKPFSCNICGASFAQRLNLKTHMKIHLSDRNFKCNLCPKTFLSSYKLKEHLKYHNNIRNFECTVCSKRFVTNTLLKRHSLIHSNEKPYMCPYCSKTFKTLTLTHQHLKKAHQGEITDANLHGIVEEEDNNETDEEIEYHYTPMPDNIQIQLNPGENLNLPLNTVEQNLQTDLTTSADLNQQTIYINSDNVGLDNENLQQCLINLLNNDYQQQNTTNLQENTVDYQNGMDLVDINNINMILNQNNISWDDLSELLTNVNDNTGNLNENLTELPQQQPQEQQDNEQESLYANTFIICLSCNNQYDTVEHFKQHNCTENESNETENGNNKKKTTKQFECIFCDELINGRKMYVKHMAIHAKNGQSNTCIFCEKQFKKPSDLKRHIRTHTGEKPFNCEKCDKSFALKSTLISHMKTHDPNVPKKFKCDVCNSYFTVRSSLKVHMLMHTDKKPYGCDYCTETFRTAAHKRSHEHSQHLKKDQEVLKEAKKDVRIKNLLESVVSEIVNNQSNDFSDNIQPDNQEIILHDNPLNVLNINAEGLDLNDTIQIDPLTLLQFQQASINLPESSSIFIDTNCGQNNEQFLQIDDGALLNNCIQQPQTFENVVQTPEVMQFNEKTNKERNLQCDICKKCYASKDVLRKHKKIHMKKYPCTICDKSFDKDVDFNKHMDLHAGLRPFNCAYCANSFGEESSLKTHLKRIHPEIETTTDDFFLKFGDDFM